jgi:hypothetical protein
MNEIKAQSAMALRSVGTETKAKQQLASSGKDKPASLSSSANELIFGQLFKLMMKEVRKGIGTDGPFRGGFAEGTFNEFYDDLTAKEFARSMPNFLSPRKLQQLGDKATSLSNQTNREGGIAVSRYPKGIPVSSDSESISLTAGAQPAISIERPAPGRFFDIRHED